MKMKASNIAIIVIAVVLYTFLLGFFGVFGETVSSIFNYFVKNILPVIGVVIGYFFVIFVPYRVIQVMGQNKERKEEYIKEQRLQNYSNAQKQEAENIRKLLNNEDEL